MCVQVMFAEDEINVLHKLEQVSSEGHVGSLAENLLEALKEEPHVAHTIDNVRATTRAEKKRMAMAKRQKQLDALGMKVGYSVSNSWCIDRSVVCMCITNQCTVIGGLEHGVDLLLVEWWSCDCDRPMRKAR